MVFRFMIKKRYVNMLRYINKRKPNMRQISKKTRFAYPMVRKVLIQLQEEKVIVPVFNTEGTARDYNIQLTQKGTNILKLFESIAKESGEVL